MDNATSSVRESQAPPKDVSQLGAHLDAFLSLPRPFPARSRPDNSGYLDSFAKTSRKPAEWNDPHKSLFPPRPASGVVMADCPSGYLTATCPDCGALYVKAMLCGREWCPECGAEWSRTHKRRYARWWEKICQMESVGYFVFTIPLHLRGRYQDKTRLRNLRTEVRKILQKRGYARGLSRFHWFGDLDRTRWNPHLNVFVDGGFLPPEKLEAIKKAYARILGIPDGGPVDVHYSYAEDVGHIVHMAKYVTRSTFTDVSTEELELLAWHVVKDFRNTHCWGGKQRWEGAVVQELTERDLPEADELKILLALEKSHCPACGATLTWEVLPGHLVGEWLLTLDLVDLGGGYMRVGEARAGPVEIAAG